jgi:hypothetical protein
VALVLTAVLVASRLGSASAAVDAGATQGPQIVVAPAQASVGDDILVEFTGWPSSPVSVALCGNDARRGSEDCDQTSSQSVQPRGTDPVYLRMTLGVPPVGCPCVIRANTISSEIVRTAPIVVADVPNGGDIPPAVQQATPDQLAVTVKLQRVEDSIVNTLVPPLGGPVQLHLFVTMHNRGATPMNGLRIVGSVGKSLADREPIGRTPAVDLRPGETTQVTVPVELSAPAFGDYTVAGSVYGAEVPTKFVVRTHNDPWALELLLPLLLILIAQLVRRRDRIRRAMDDADGASTASVDEPVLLHQSSPRVGDAYGPNSNGASYDLDDWLGPPEGAGTQPTRGNPVATDV